MNYHIVERDAFQVVGVKQKFSYGTRDIGIPGVPEFWESEEKKGTVDQLIPLIDGEIKVLLGITENYNQEKSTIDYWIAAEYSGEVPNEFLSIVYPASKWVVFEVIGRIPSAKIPISIERIL